MAPLPPPTETRTVSRTMSRFARDEAGATAIEYALIASLIFLVIITAVTLFATNVTDMWNSIAAHI